MRRWHRKFKFGIANAIPKCDYIIANANSKKIENGDEKDRLAKFHATP
jgi:hypothetical protein